MDLLRYALSRSGAVSGVLGQLHSTLSEHKDLSPLVNGASLAVERARSVAWNIEKFGLVEGLARFGTTEGLNRLMDETIKERARKAENAGMLTCICSLLVLAFSLLDALVPVLLKIYLVSDALGVGFAGLILLCIVGGWAIHKAVEGMDWVAIARLVYLSIVVFTALSRHVLLFQGALGILRRATGTWTSWELNTPVLAIGFALIATALLNRKVTSKHTLLAKVVACWLLGGLESWRAIGELAFRVAHFLLAYFVEETAPVPDVALWYCCWCIVHRVDGFTESVVSYMFEGETDVVELGRFLIRCSSALMESYSFEDLLIPQEEVRQAVLGYHYLSLALTGVFAVKGCLLWYMAALSQGSGVEWTMLDALGCTFAAVGVIATMGWIAWHDRLSFARMDRAEFFFARKLEYFEQLKVWVQYEELKKNLARGAKREAPSNNINVVFYGKVSSGKTQLIKALLTQAGSNDADKVQNISAVGGSTAACEKYIAKKLVQDPKEEGQVQDNAGEPDRCGYIVFVDTPGLDECVVEPSASEPVDPLEDVDLCLVVFNGDSDEDLYSRFLEAVQAICKKNGYEKGSKEYRQAWRRTILVRTHGDLFAWGLSPKEEFLKGWTHWPPSLRTLIEATRTRINDKVLAENEFDADFAVTDFFHLSTKKGSAGYGVDLLWERILKMASGTEGRIIALERKVGYQEGVVESLHREVNEIAGTINRQAIMRKLFNVMKTLLDPFLALRQQAWTNDWIHGYRQDEARYKKLKAKLESEKEKLESLKHELASLQNVHKYCKMRKYTAMAKLMPRELNSKPCG